MENTVTMTLEDYTNIIKENILLKSKLEQLKTNAKIKIEEEIKDGLIYQLSKEETVAWLNETNSKKLLAQFTGNYSWTWSSIAKNSYVLSEEEVKEMAVSSITKMLNCHLIDLNEKEEAGKNE